MFESYMAASVSVAKSGPVLDPVEWRSFKLAAKDKLSPNTARYVTIDIGSRLS